MNGIIVIDKEIGYSSNRVVVQIKKLFNEKKVGHLGTLDPLASGVLPICLGKATRLFDYYLNKTKTYIAKFTFGKETDTLDSEGNVIKITGNIPSLDLIKEKVKLLTGKIEQIPPKYSAKSVNGIRAYNLARKGIDFDLKPKQVEVIKFEVIKQVSNDTFEFMIDCSSGTYIRSLARDLGQLCSSCAFMRELKRIRSGEFEIKNAVKLENVKQSSVIPIEKLLNNIERIDVDARDYDKLKNGVKIFTENQDKSICTVYSKNELFGIGEIKDNYIKIKTYLHN